MKSESALILLSSFNNLTFYVNSGAVAPAVTGPVPDVDLSHLSAEERAMIENVMAKAQQLEHGPPPPQPGLAQGQLAQHPPHQQQHPNQQHPNPQHPNQQHPNQQHPNQQHPNQQHPNQNQQQRMMRYLHAYLCK